MRTRWSFCFCCAAGLVMAAVGTAERAAGQDRVDRITESAARIQGTESFGQPYERGDQGFYEGGYQFGQRPNMQGSFQQGYAQQGQWDQQQWDQYGDRFGQRSMQRDWQGGDSPAGLGVVLRETGEQGVEVTDVHRGSPAAEAGLRPGDQIVAVNGRRTDSVQELQSRVMQQDPGDRVEIVALRNGQQQTFDARLEPRREALNRQQAQYQQGRQYQQGGSQDRQIQTRLASLERQLQQLLREVRTLQNSVESQTTQTDFAPQPPRQAQRQDGRFWQSGQQWDEQQQGQRSATDQYYEDSRRQNQGQFDF